MLWCLKKTHLRQSSGSNTHPCHRDADLQVPFASLSAPSSPTENTCCSNHENTYQATCTIPQIRPVPLDFSRLQIHFVEMNPRPGDTRSALCPLTHVENVCEIKNNILNTISMAPHNILVPIVVPKGTCIVALEVKVHSITPLTLVPDI